MGVHLIDLSGEWIKASIHALKLCHDRLEGHNTHSRRRMSGCGWSGRSQRSRRPNPWSLRMKLGLAPSNGSRVYGTYHEELRRLGIGDKCMMENPHDSKGKIELIMGRCILIDIYKGEYEKIGRAHV